MEDFEKIVIADVAVETVNLTRATYKEAAELKKIINEDIARRFKKIVIDLSQCEFIDSTFIGVLVVSLKNIASIGGELHIIRPASIAHSILEMSGTLDIFNLCDNMEEAINSFSNTENKVEHLSKECGFSSKTTHTF
jgi:anti-anti-sigma factor